MTESVKVSQGHFVFCDAWKKTVSWSSWGKQYFNVASDLIKGMNKGYSGKSKNLVWLNSISVFHTYYCVENNIDYTDIGELNMLFTDWENFLIKSLTFNQENVFY